MKLFYKILVLLMTLFMLHIGAVQFSFAGAADSGAGKITVHPPMGSAVIVEDIPQASSARLSASSNVSGATVYVDGQSMGIAPLREKIVSAGDHQVRVVKDTYNEYQTQVNIESGRHVSIEAYLTKRSHLFIATVPLDTNVRILHLNIDILYTIGMELSPGSYTVEVSKDGYETKIQSVSMTIGEDRYMTIVLPPTKKNVAEAFRSPFSSASSPPIRVTNSLGMDFMYISPGTFWMGSPSDETDRYEDEVRHEVTLTNGYYLQTTEVTQGQWKAIMDSNPSYFSDCGENCPVEQVSWDDVQEFIYKLNQKEGAYKYRLPTEAEWEYACRAGTDTPFQSHQPMSTDLANYDGRSGFLFFKKGMCRGATIPVGTLAANSYELYDMHGNVYEWCSDWYADYPSFSVTDPLGPSSGDYRVNRGGSWYCSASLCRSAYRYDNSPDTRYSDLGFRLLRTP